MSKCTCKDYNNRRDEEPTHDVFLTDPDCPLHGTKDPKECKWCEGSGFNPAKEVCHFCRGTGVQGKTTKTPPSKAPLRELSCSRCKQDLPLDNFYESTSTGKRGYMWYCKKCVSEYTRAQYEKHHAKKRAGHKRYKQTERGKEVARESSKRTYLKHIDKVPARVALREAVRTGKLKREPCEKCGDEKSEAHHYKGYDKPNYLNVQWLCRTHHKEAEGVQLVKKLEEK